MEQMAIQFVGKLLPPEKVQELSAKASEFFDVVINQSKAIQQEQQEQRKLLEKLLNERQPGIGD